MNLSRKKHAEPVDGNPLPRDGDTDGFTQQETREVEAPESVELSVEDREKVRRACEYLKQIQLASASAGVEFPVKSSGVATKPHLLPERIGRYRIINSLGRGGFAEVFLAEDEDLDRRVALKIPLVTGLSDNQFNLRFQREARAAALLAHPNIVPVHEFGCVGPLQFIASAWVQGTNLANWLTENSKSISSKEAADIVATLAEAMEHAHQRNVIHRDLKPSNILIDESDPTLPLASRLRIADFGLARQLDVDLTLTRDGDALGTPAYMSPEQAAGSIDISMAADIWSLGVILYELLTGHLPFRGSNVLDTLKAVQQDSPAPIHKWNAEVPSALAAICLKCLSKNPSARYHSAFLLAEDLRRWIQGFPVSARPANAPERLVAWSRRNPALATMAVTVLFSLTIGLGAATWQWRAAANNLEKFKSEFQRAEQNLTLANKALDQERSQRERATEIARFLGKTYRSPDPRLDGREIKVVELLARAEQEIAVKFANDDESRWMLLLDVGKSWYSLGQNDEALHVLTKILEEQTTAQRPMDEHSVDLLNYVSKSKINKGEFDGGLDFADQAVQLSMQVFGENHLVTWKISRDKASALANLGRIDEAMDLRQLVIDFYQTSSDVDSEEHFSARVDYANGLQQQRKNAEAELLYLELVPELASQLGIDHPLTMAAKTDLINVLSRQGKLEDIVELRTEVWESAERVLGPMHPQTLLVMHNLASSLAIVDRKTEAIDVYTVVIDRSRETFGYQSPFYFLPIINAANCHRDLRQYAEALTLYEQGIPGLQSTIGRDHPRTLSLLPAYAECLESNGHFVRAFLVWEEIRQGELSKTGIPTVQSESAGFRQSLLLIKTGDVETGLRDVASFFEKLPTIASSPDNADVSHANSLAALLATLISVREFNHALPFLDQHSKLTRGVPGREALERLGIWFEATISSGSGQGEWAGSLVDILVAFEPGLTRMDRNESEWVDDCLNILMVHASDESDPLHDRLEALQDLQHWFDLTH